MYEISHETQNKLFQMCDTAMNIRQDNFSFTEQNKDILITYKVKRSESGWYVYITSQGKTHSFVLPYIIYDLQYVGSTNT